MRSRNKNFLAPWLKLFLVFTSLLLCWPVSAQEVSPITGVRLLQRLPGNDPVIGRVTSLRGKLAYSSFVPFAEGTTPETSLHYIVLQEAAKQKTVGLQVKTLCLDVRAPFWVFDPQFSPDGERILFKVGIPDQNFSLYAFFVWNTKEDNVIANNLLTEGPRYAISARWLKWSPDSKRIAFWGPSSGGAGLGQKPESTKLLSFDLDTGSETVVSTSAKAGSAWWSGDSLYFKRASGGSSTGLSAFSFSNKEVIAAIPGTQRLSNPVSSPQGKYVLFKKAAGTDGIGKVLSAKNGGNYVLFNSLTKSVQPVVVNVDESSPGEDGNVTVADDGTVVTLNQFSGRAARLATLNPSKVSPAKPAPAIKIQAPNAFGVDQETVFKLLPTYGSQVHPPILVKMAGKAVANRPTPNIIMLKRTDLSETTITDVATFKNITGADVWMQP